MKLSELLKDAVFPVKIRRKDWSNEAWVEIVADKKAGSYLAFNNDDHATYITDHPEYSNWELWTEPKPKKKLYGWIVSINGNHLLKLYESDQIPLKLSPIEQWSRAPSFDCEVLDG